MNTKIKENVSTFWTKLRGWRTVIFGTAVASTPLLIEPLSELSSMDLTPIFKEHAEGIATALGIAVVFLRILTLAPVGHSTEEGE